MSDNTIYVCGNCLNEYYAFEMDFDEEPYYEGVALLCPSCGYGQHIVIKRNEKYDKGN